MELPNYMSIRCTFGGDVLKCSADISVKSIFEIVDSTSLSKLQSYIQKEIEEQEFAQLKFIKLIDDRNYWLDIKVNNNTKEILFNLNLANTSAPEKFWTDIVFEYEYFITKGRNIINSVGRLIEGLFYKNRSDINDILQELCLAFKFQKALLLFHNGHDHVMYGKDIVIGFEVKDLTDKFPGMVFHDEHFDKDVVFDITDVLRLKKYKDTYFKTFITGEGDDEDDVYVLKLMFGQKAIGYLELVPHKSIVLRKTELQLLQSLSAVLAYVINNKCESKEIEDYIKKKMSISLS